VKVAWLTWLPTNGSAAVELKKHLNGNGGLIEIVSLTPQQKLTPAKASQIVAELSREYDAVAFIANPVLIEAARNFKIQNFRKEGMTFARWLCPDFYGTEADRVEGVRWCQVS
jgi:hypothetical protein